MVFFEFDEKGNITRCSNASMGPYSVGFHICDDEIKIITSELNRIEKYNAFAENSETLAKEKVQFEKEKKEFNSKVCKIRMNAYKQAAGWDNSIEKKIEILMYKAKNGNLFQRLVEYRIWRYLLTQWKNNQLKK